MDTATLSAVDTGAVNPYCSPAYADLNRALLDGPSGYGRGQKHAGAILAWARHIRAWSILDYGCGRGQLGVALRKRGWGKPVREYDPAIPGKDALPIPADLVVCCDVLEHVEPEHVQAVLQHIQQLATRGIYAVVATRVSNKTLADGRNAHLIVKPASWWIRQVRRAGWRLVQSEWPKDKRGRARGVILWAR